MTENGHRGGRRKQITFDLNQKALAEHYPRPKITVNPTFYKKAYADISRFMKESGFEHRQFSVYTSKDRMTEAKVVALVDEMVIRMPWLAPCVNQIDVTNIGSQHSLLRTLEYAASEMALTEEQSHQHEEDLDAVQPAPMPSRQSFQDLAAAAKAEAAKRNDARASGAQQHKLPEKQER